jgi:hypothetical protein
MSVRLTQAVVEVERHAAASGWDQPARLFALVDTEELLAREPHLAAAIGNNVQTHPGGSATLTPIEQEDLGDEPLDELLARIVWPPEVVGCAVVVERLMLPPSAEPAVADLDDAAAAEKVAEHPEREEVRIAVGVTRDGDRECAIRLRSMDDDRSVVSGSDLVPNLVEALAATLEG